MKTSIICINAVFSILNTHPLFKSRFLYFFLEIKVNSQGKRCVVKANRLTNKTSQSTQSSSWSPVSSFEKYLRVLDAINKNPFSATKVIWRRRSLVWQHGCRENTLGNSRRWKSHNISGVVNNIRATTITILHRSGFVARHIMSVLSHKNESRIKSCSKTDENTKTNMAGLVAVTYNKKPTLKISWLLKQAKMTEIRSLVCLQIP